MAHTTGDKERLLHRVRRIRGQLEAIERALGDERDCSEIMHLLAACRGAVGSLTAEVLEGHVRSHIVEAASSAQRGRAADDLIDVLKTYVR
jgi:DNA-binding FrmR family transcriptional regulator